MKKTMTAMALVMGLTLAAGGAMAMHHGGKGEMGGQGMMQGKMMQRDIPGVSKETQKKLFEARKAGMEKHKAAMEQMKTKREELKKIISAEKFDKKAFLAKKAEMNVIKDKMHSDKANDMAAVYEKMSASERKAWVKHTHQRMERKRQMHEKRRMMRKTGTPMKVDPQPEAPQ